MLDVAVGVFERVRDHADQGWSLVRVARCAVAEQARTTEPTKLPSRQGHSCCDLGTQQCPVVGLMPFRLLGRWFQAVVQREEPTCAVRAEVALQGLQTSRQDPQATQRAVFEKLPERPLPGRLGSAVLVDVREADLAATLDLENAP